jgi:hypothetical protein
MLQNIELDEWAIMYDELERMGQGGVMDHLCLLLASDLPSNISLVLPSPFDLHI